MFLLSIIACNAWNPRKYSLGEAEEGFLCMVDPRQPNGKPLRHGKPLNHGKPLSPTCVKADHYRHELDSKITKLEVSVAFKNQKTGGHASFLATLANGKRFKIDQYSKDKMVRGRVNAKANLIRIQESPPHEDKERRNQPIEMQVDIRVEELAIAMLDSLSENDYAYNFQTNSCLTSVLKPSIQLGIIHEAHEDQLKSFLADVAEGSPLKPVDLDRQDILETFDKQSNEIKKKQAGSRRIERLQNFPSATTVRKNEVVDAWED